MHYPSLPPSKEERVDYLEKLAVDMELRGLRPSTRRRYLLAVREAQEYFDDWPLPRLTYEQLRAYLTHVREKKGPSVQYMRVAALRFLYRQALGMPLVAQRIPYPRMERPAPLPVLNRRQAGDLLGAFEKRKYRAIAMTMYGAGLRVTEACSLAQEHVDSQRMVLFVADGKGGVARYATLSPRLLEELRGYWRECRPEPPHLFPGRSYTGRVAKETMRQAVAGAAAKAGIKQRVTPHTLRHSFATHMLEAGVEMRVIQGLLGHRSPRSTTIYTRVTAEIASSTTSPLEALSLPWLE